MSITIKQIAELSGVSRGTVDRVLNNRGNVKPETEQKVKYFAEKLGYKPNFAGKALAANKKTMVIGVLLASEGNSFFDDVFRGIQRAEEELENYRIRVEKKTMKGYDVNAQVALIESMENDVDALIINPVNDPHVAAKINELESRKKPVITINTDIENTNRTCYVGSDYIRGGETACGMMGILTNGKANLGIITGSIHILGHTQRIRGFRNVMEKRYPEIHLIDLTETNDDDIQAYENTLAMLKKHPEINALFIVAAGGYGVCRAVQSLELQGKIRIVSFDAIPSTVEMVQKGIINATICQQPFTQGNKSMHIAFERLVSGMEPLRDQYIMKNEIKIFENI